MDQDENEKTLEMLKLINQLDQEQRKIIKEYLNELEQKKIEELRSQLGIVNQSPL